MKNNQKSLDKINSEVAANLQTLVNLNDDIADNPEISLHEFETSKKMVELLRSKGFEVEYPLCNWPTAFRAIKGSNNHKYKVAILTEYDALPEIGHACGHCLSGTISLLAGIATSDLQDELNADVHIIGTPDEEFYGTKVQMVSKGLFENYDMAMMIHLYDQNLIKTRLLAMDTYTYNFHGKAAHASAAPWEGRNAYNASQLMFHGIDMLRQHVTPDVRIHGMVRNTGEAPNIVPEENSLEMYIRALERNNLNEVVRKVDDCARGAAIATQTTWDKRLSAEVYDNMLDIESGLEILEDVYKELDIPLNGDKDLIFGSSDVGNVSMVCPTFHATLQVVDKGVAIHTREFANAMKTERAHKVLELGAKVIGYQIVKVFSDEKNIINIKEEFGRLRK